MKRNRSDAIAEGTAYGLMTATAVAALFIVIASLILPGKLTNQQIDDVLLAICIGCPAVGAAYGALKKL